MTWWRNVPEWFWQMFGPDPCECGPFMPDQIEVAKTAAGLQPRSEASLERQHQALGAAWCRGGFQVRWCRVVPLVQR